MTTSVRVSKSALADTDYPPARAGWYTVGALYVAYTLAFVDRQIIAFLVGPIRADLQISDFQFSLIHGLAFAIFYATLGIPIGRLADTGSRRGIIAIGVGLWSLMTAACGMASSYWQLFLARIGVGVGEATLSPAAISMIADYFPPAKRGLPINVYSAGVHGGAGLANVFGGLVAGFALAAGARELPLLGLLRPWQLAFVLVGLPGLIVALWAYTLKEPRRHERGAAPGGVRFADTAAYLVAHRSVYLTLILGGACAALASYATFSWVPALFDRRFGWGSARIGLAFGTITFVCGTAGLILTGWLAGRLARARVKAAYSKLMIATMVCAIPPAVLLVAIRDPCWTLGCLTLLVLFLGAPIGLVQAALAAVTPNEMRAQVIAVYLFAVTVIGIGSGPSAVAAITDYYFANDAAVGASMACVATFAAVVSAFMFVLGVPAYARKAGDGTP